MKRFLRRCFPLAAALPAIFLAVVSMPVWAWNAAGHRLTVALAWPQLSAGTQRALERLLDAHPAAESWRKRIRDPWSGAMLAEAATWPDNLRRAAKLAGDGKAAPGSGPADDAVPDVHRDWHYFDWPIGQPKTSARGGQLETQIERQSEIMGDERRPAVERAVALAWVVHLIGDAHTPLHAATWRGAHGDWTAGGNGLAVFDPGDSQRPETNLHRFWDELPGPSWLRGKALIRRAGDLQGGPPDIPSPSAANDTPALWIEESHALATRIVPVGEGSAAVFVMTEEYRESARQIAGRQLVLAGRRLARWLEQRLGASSGQ